MEMPETELFKRTLKFLTFDYHQCKNWLIKPFKDLDGFGGTCSICHKVMEHYKYVPLNKITKREKLEESRKNVFHRDGDAQVNAQKRLKKVRKFAPKGPSRASAHG